MCLRDADTAPIIVRILDGAIVTTDWHTALRSHFPIVNEARYLNIAYTSPLAPVVSKAVGAFFDDITHARSDKPQWLRDAERCREQIARLVNGKARAVAFTKNTCEALNIVAQGLAWRPGDNLVTNDEEHPSNQLPWINLHRRGVEIRTVRARDRRLEIDDIVSRIDTRTRVVAVSWVQSTTGQRLDLGALSRACRERGARLVVDGIQGLGLLSLDLADTPIDALAGGSHKGLLGPLGLGFLHLSDALLDELDPAALGPSAVVSAEFDDQDSWQIHAGDRLDARRLENGNLNYPGIAGLSRALDLIDNAGPANIEAWVSGLNREFASQLRRANLDVVTPGGPPTSATTTVRSAEAAALNARLREAGVVASVVERDYLRFAFGPYNNAQDVEAVAALLT